MLSAMDTVCTLSDKLVFNGNVPDAVKLVTEAIVVAPLKTNLFQLWWQRAGCNYVAGRYADAVKDFEAADTIMPGPMEFFYTYGMLLFNIGHWQKATTMFDKTLTLLLAGCTPLSLMPSPLLPAIKVHMPTVPIVHQMRAKCAYFIALAEGDPEFKANAEKKLAQQDKSGQPW